MIRHAYNGSRVKPGMTIPSDGITNIRNGMTDKGGGMKKKRGFTLLEVMIALLVITLGMGAVINTTGESGWKSAQLKQGTIANWVAQNQIAEYRAKRTWNNATKKSGEVEMANTEWVWQMKISKTDDPSLRRLDVDVFIKGEDVLKASVTGFIGLL
jgi:general secretion pathway protein I